MCKIPTRHVSRIVGDVAAYLTDFLDEPQAFRGQLLRGGGAVADFEALLAQRCGFPYCVATSNATTALMGLALVLNLRNKSIWFPKMHWEGSVSAMRVMGVKIRRYECGSTLLKRTRKNSAPLFWVSQENNSWQESPERSSGDLMIEDSSRIPGLTCDASSMSKSDVQVLSFGPGKPLSLGEGGAILFRKKAHHERFLAVTMHPERFASSREAKVRRVCLNARIHPLAAMIGARLLADSEAAGA